MLNSEIKKETIQRGSIFFPIQYYHCNTASPLYNLPVHWHFEYEILHILKGNYLAFIDEQEIEIKQGDYCFLKGGVIHGDGHKKTGCVYESVVFDIELIRNRIYAFDNFINKVEENSIKIPFYISSSKEKICNSLKIVYSSMIYGKNGYELLVMSGLMQFFGYLDYFHLYNENIKENLKAKFRLNQFKLVFSYIEKNYSQQISLEELASEAHISPKYFCRIFKEKTHRTPFEYLNEYRVSQACNKLISTNDALVDIANDCGFNDFSYFIKIFRRFKGMTPHKYRTYKDNIEKE